MCENIISDSYVDKSDNQNTVKKKIDIKYPDTQTINKMKRAYEEKKQSLFQREKRIGIARNIAIWLASLFIFSGVLYMVSQFVITVLLQSDSNSILINVFTIALGLVLSIAFISSDRKSAEEKCDIYLEQFFENVENLRCGTIEQVYINSDGLFCIVLETKEQNIIGIKIQINNKAYKTNIAIPYFDMETQTLYKPYPKSGDIDNEFIEYSIPNILYQNR